MELFLIAAVVILIVAGVLARSGSDCLKTEAAESGDVQGTFTLLLYGSGSSKDPARLAILDREGDAYSFEIHAPAFSHTIQTGLNAPQALQEAERFVRRDIRSERSRLCRILSPAGAGIGFELRPLYSVAAFGRDDILDVRYSIKDRKIVARVTLDPEMEKQSAG